MSNVKCKNFELTESDIEIYMAGSMTLVSLAKSRGVSRHTMVRWLNKTGRDDVIKKIRSRRYFKTCDDNQKAEAEKRLKLGWKVDAIALDTGLSNTTIRKIKRNMNTLDNRS